MSYRKTRTNHDEIRLCLTYRTHHNPAEKKRKQCLSTTQQ